MVGDQGGGGGNKHNDRQPPGGMRQDHGPLPGRNTAVLSDRLVHFPPQLVLKFLPKWAFLYSLVATQKGSLCIYIFPAELFTVESAHPTGRGNWWFDVRAGTGA